MGFAGGFRSKIAASFRLVLCVVVIVYGVYLLVWTCLGLLGFSVKLFGKSNFGSWWLRCLCLRRKLFSLRM